MASDRSENRVRFSNLNWLGKTVYAGASVLRVAAKAIDKTADRVNQIAEESREAYLREVDPNIEDAKVIEETPRETQRRS
ncbi:hypothetical protein CRI94_07940 [Longibacter salinarum]|uniref:Uncharacterized protein n=1 Tax=Longibacter salinarum TaxID=1850348 RepID=A0A2A8CZE3_9BACT|nr:hypothetical protein [Longibacter salinarum]PEN13973.1 hypothetical protein CRI94_07940 [Longibacter salinarum]